MKTWHVSDVMTTGVITAGPDALYRDLVELLTTDGINAVPVVDDFRRVLGVVSMSDLLAKIEYSGTDQPPWYRRRRRTQWRKADALTAAELMSSPAVTVHRGTGIAAAARRMEEAGIKQLPVEDDLGRIAGIVTRSDLLKVHLRADDDIRADVRRAADEVLLTENVAAVEIGVDRGSVTLNGRVDRWSTAVLVPKLAQLVPGVVDVDAHIDYNHDDHKAVASSPAFFVA
jgi:CBS-domain-containing membrane protein